MNYLKHKRTTAQRRANRVRTSIKSPDTLPRLSVNISNYHISAQIINDAKGETLAYATTVGMKVQGTMTEKAATVGQQIAEQALKLKIKKVVFDRGAKRYHGRIKSLAEAAREAGMEF